MANKILIVDDDRATRDELAQLLTHEGYETLTASDVPTAMHILGASAPDLLITEIRLDTYNGLHIIAMAPTPIPAIGLTRIPDPVIEADARRFGAEDPIQAGVARNAPRRNHGHAWRRERT